VPERKDLSAFTVVDDAKVHVVANPFEERPAQPGPVAGRQTYVPRLMLEKLDEIRELLIEGAWRLVSVLEPPPPRAGDLAHRTERELDGRNQAPRPRSCSRSAPAPMPSPRSHSASR